MGGAGRGRQRRSAARARRAREGSRAGRGQEDARRRARSRQRHRHHPPGRRRHRVAGLGRDAAAHVSEVGGAARLQARGARLPAGRRSRHQERDHHAERRIRVRPDGGRGRRAPPGAHLAVRSGGAPAHVVCVGLCLAGDRGRHRHRDPGKGSAHRHLPIERRRRPARQRHRLRRPHHAPADRASSCRVRTSDRSTRIATSR